MKTKNTLCGLAVAVVLQMGLLAGSAQTNKYLFSGSKTNITLPPGTYIITAYGAQGGRGLNIGGFGDWEEAEFNFSMSTTLTLLVGGMGGSGGERNCGGGGGGSFVVEGSTPLVIAGGGGGCGYIDDGYNGWGGFNGPNGGNGQLGGFGYSGGSGTGGTGGGGGSGGGSYGGGYSGGGGGGGFLGNGGNGTNIGSYLQGGDGTGGGSFESGGGAPYGHGIYENPYVGGFGGGGGGGTGETDGGGGGGGGYSGGGGAGAEIIDPLDYLAGGGGGGGSIIDSSAIAILYPTTSPDDVYNGEIIITAVPTPLLITKDAAFGFTNGVFGFNVIGPAGSNVVIEASTDLQTWIPLQANLLDSGPLYFSDPQWTNYPERFYRVTSAFTVGGTLTGLPAGETVTLQDNGSDDLTLSNNGTFTFPTALPNGQSYYVTYIATTSRFGAYTFFTNGSGTISGANVTNVAVTFTPVYTGYLDVDMYNAAVADGTAHGGVPAVMGTPKGGPFRVTAAGGSRTYSYQIARIYSASCIFTTVVGTYSCSSTTLPSGTQVIQFGTVLECGVGPYQY